MSQISHTPLDGTVQAHVCPVCFNLFTQKSAMQRHINDVHNSLASSFPCSQAGCGYSTKRKADLLRHMKTHQKCRKLLIDNDPLINDHTTPILQSIMRGVGIDPTQDTGEVVATQGNNDNSNYSTINYGHLNLTPVNGGTNPALIGAAIVPSTIASYNQAPNATTAAQGYEVTPDNNVQQIVSVNNSVIGSNAANTSSFSDKTDIDTESDSDSCSLMQYSAGEIFVVNPGLQFVRFRADIGTKLKVVPEGLAIDDEVPEKKEVNEPTLTITGNFKLKFNC